MKLLRRLACLVSETVIPSGQRECVCFDHHPHTAPGKGLWHCWLSDRPNGQVDRITYQEDGEQRGEAACWNDVAESKQSLGSGVSPLPPATILLGWRIQLLRPALASPTAGILAAVSPSLPQLAGVSQPGWGTTP